MAIDWMDVGSASLRYDISGPHDAPPLILVHEMGGSIETWDKVVPRFADRFRVLRFDFRGFGQSEKIVGDIGLKDLAGDLKNLLDALRIDKPAVVAGCAVGAGVAAGLTAWWPEHVAGLVMFSPSVGVPPETRAERLAAADRLAASGLRLIAENSLNNGFPEPFRSERPDVFAAFCGRWMGNDPHSFAAVFRMLARLDIAPVLEAIDRPTLCVACTLDVFRPPEYTESIAARIVGAKLATIVSGHHSPQITPEAVADVIAEFCDTIPSHSRAGAGA